MSLLGSMLLDQRLERIGLVIQILPRDEAHRFYRQDHRILFETIVDLWDARKPMDIILVEDELRRRGRLEDVGGRDYLIDLVNSVPSIANCEFYARIVRDKAMLRDLIQCTTEITHAAYEQKDTAAEVLDTAEKHLFEVTEQRVSKQAVPIRVGLEEVQKLLDDKDGGMMTGVPTGFTDLDHLLGGLQNGDFIVIAARPSMGKTALGLSMLEYVGIVEKQPVVFFSLEMSLQQIALRMLCSHALVDMQKLRHGNLSNAERQKLKLTAGGMKRHKVFIDDSAGMSVMELRAKARRLKMLHDIKVVFVDYLQLMHDRVAAKENRQAEIATISRGLKALARELEIPVVAMAQLNRQVETRRTGASNRPRMSDLRESGAIEQDADVVALLHREDYYWDKDKRSEQDAEFQKIQGKAELIIDKQRNGPTGIVKLHFNPNYTRFDNPASEFIQGEDQYGGPADESYEANMSIEQAADMLPSEDDDEAPF